jgi:hypothetical protein
MKRASALFFALYFAPGHGLPYLCSMKRGFILAWMLILMGASSCSTDSGCSDPNALNFDSTASPTASDCAYPGREYGFPVFYFGSTQSAASGAFSLPFFQTLDMSHPSAIPISVYGAGNDPLYSASAPGILAAYGITSFPKFCVGTQASTSEATLVESDIQREFGMATAIGLEVNRVNAGGDSLVWEVFGYRYQGLHQAAFVNVYALIPETLAVQAGGVNQPERHLNVLAEGAAASGIGTEVLFSETGSPAFRLRLSMLRPASSRRYVAVVWLANGNTYLPANAVWIEP